MAKVGRPTKYNPAMCADLIGIMADGFSKEAASAKLGISHQTFYRWQDPNDPNYQQEFCDAVKEGERLSHLWWEQKGMEGMTGEIQGFNATTWIFNMKNRHGWSDKVEQTTTHQNPDGSAVTFEFNAVCRESE